mmetsp:Transcript_21897/g.48954  ORF Transcript_21897/g.48954 Transcript_21897/m.48954 type:complete len:85 (+) Transcript_21897:1245-1499(+)
MDQFVEDIDSMDKEFDFWKKQGDVWQDKIQSAEKENEENLGKITGKINIAEENIRTQKTRINNLKSQIFKNEQQLKNVLKNFAD